MTFQHIGMFIVVDQVIPEMYFSLQIFLPLCGFFCSCLHFCLLSFIKVFCKTNCEKSKFCPLTLNLTFLSIFAAKIFATQLIPEKFCLCRGGRTSWFHRQLLSKSYLIFSADIVGVIINVVIAIMYSITNIALLSSDIFTDGFSPNRILLVLMAHPPDEHYHQSFFYLSWLTKIAIIHTITISIEHYRHHWVF